MADKRELSIILKLKDEMSREMSKIGTHIDSHSEKYRKLGMAMTVVGGSMLMTGLAAIKAAGRFEQSTIAFTTMIGDADVAAQTLEDLAQFAAATPFELQGIEDSAKKLLAYGIGVQDLIPTLKMLGDISAGVGTDKMPQLILALGQVKARGVLAGQELLQFMNTGVSLVDELAEVTGHSVAEITGQTAKLRISYEDVEKALSNLTKKGGKFHDLMDKQSKSLFGSVSNLKDSIDLFLRDAGEPMLINSKAIVFELTNWVDAAREVTKENDTLAEYVGYATVGGGALATILGVGLVAGAGKAALAIRGVGTALKFALGPWGFFIAAATTAASFISTKLNKSHLEYAATHDKIREAHDRQYEAIIKAREGVKTYNTAIKEMSKEAIEAAQKITDLEKEISKTIKKEGDKTTSYKQDVAQAFIDQEEKIADLRKEIGEKIFQDQKDIKDKEKLTRGEMLLEKRVDLQRELTELKEKTSEETKILQDSLAEEQEALNRMRISKFDIAAELVEMKRRSELTEFELHIENLMRQRASDLEAFAEKLTLYKEEMKELKNQHQALIAQQQVHTEELKKEEEKRVTAVESATNRIIYSMQKRAGATGGVTTPVFTPMTTEPIPMRYSLGIGESTPEVNVTVNGDVSGEELVNTVQNAIMHNLHINTKFAS